MATADDEIIAIDLREKGDEVPYYKGAYHGPADNRDHWKALSKDEQRGLNRQLLEEQRAAFAEPRREYFSDPLVFRGRDGRKYRSRYRGLYYEAYADPID